MNKIDGLADHEMLKKSVKKPKMASVRNLPCLLNNCFFSPSGVDCYEYEWRILEHALSVCYSSID